MTYREQLTACCVDATSLRPFASSTLLIMTITSGWVQCKLLHRWLSVATVGTFLLSFYLGGGVEINEQLSLRNSLNALCYQTNYVNFVFPTMFMNEVLKLTSSCHEIIR